MFSKGSRMCFKRILVGLFLLYHLGVNADEQQSSQSYQLMLVGGELPYCRSSELQLCNTLSLNDFGLKLNRRTSSYRVSTYQIKQLMAPKLWHYSRQVLRHDLNIVLLNLSMLTANQSFTKEQLFKLLITIQVVSEGRYLNGHSLFASLTANERNMFWDFLEQPQLNSFSARIKETVNLKDPQYFGSIDLFKQIITQAKLIKQTAKPNVLIITAGDRDPFKNVDALVDVFEQLGAKAQWLPISVALSAAMSHKNGCNNLDYYRNSVGNNFSREKIYPDLTKFQGQLCDQPQKMSQAIMRADAVLFTGKQPRLIKQSLFDHHQTNGRLLTLIKQQMVSNKLFVASIGPATLAMTGGVDTQGQAIAMITNGTSDMAFRHGTTTKAKECAITSQCLASSYVEYDEKGGLGLFNLGVIDIGTSSRSNFGRLTKVAYDSHNNYGIGLDPLSGLLIKASDKDIQFKVVGLDGVTILSHQKTKSFNNAMDLTDIEMSYLTPQDTGVFSNNNIGFTFAKWKRTPSDFEGGAANFTHLFSSHNFNKFSEQACLTQQDKWLAFAGRNRAFKIELAKSKDSSVKFGGVKIGNDYQLYCSINKLLLSITRR